MEGVSDARGQALSGKQARISLSSVRLREAIIWRLLGAPYEGPGCRLVVLAGTASATEWGVDYTPEIYTTVLQYPSPFLGPLRDLTE